MSSLLNDDNNKKKNKTDKKKPRVKEINKGTGYVPEKNRFKTNTNPNINTNTIEKTNKIATNTISNSQSIKENSNKNEEIKKVKSVAVSTNNKKNNKSQSQPQQNEIIDKNYLNENEKDGMYSLMGLVNNNAEKDRDESIYSVEYLFDSKNKKGNKMGKVDVEFNDKLREAGKSAGSLKELQALLSEYNNSIKNDIIMSGETLIAIVNACLR